MPRWGWVTLAILSLVLLPLYIRWFVFAVGGCAASQLLRELAPMVG